MTDSLNRSASLNQLASPENVWDIAIVGGGATGVGIALDAASRGYKVCLLEQHDFGKGTSSRSTKLIHGGVRYLAQGNITLVREALHERALLLRNAPALVHPLSFVIPIRNWLDGVWYRTGIALYDGLAGSAGAGKSTWLGRQAMHQTLPGVRNSFDGGIQFFDAQFDDARLLIAMARAAARHGAVLLNYAPVTGFLQESGRVAGLTAVDGENPAIPLEVRARVVINATGAFSDAVRRSAGVSGSSIAVSRGSHVVVDRSFLPSESALLIPKTPDGRVLFAIPWYGHTLIGTTDLEVDAAPLEPRPSAAEIDFILETASGYLQRPPRRSDVLSAWAGMRPLFRGDQAGVTAGLSREHALLEDAPGLVSIIGGKWTTWRRMAQDCVDLAARVAGLESRDCRTERIRLTDGNADRAGSEPIHPRFSWWTRADVVQAVRSEMARTVEDVLARRTRILFLDANAALESAERVAGWMAAEFETGPEWVEAQAQQFTAVARLYLPG